MIFDQFEMIRIVSLATRKDRRRLMMRELKRVGLADDPRVKFFDAVRPDDAGVFSSIGAHGCYLSHLAILKDAAAKGMSVLILEDDCDFTSKASTYEGARPWDIFYGGYWAERPDNLRNSDIIGSHVMGFTAPTAKRVAEYLDSLRRDADCPSIDGAYVWFRRAYPDVRTLFAQPTIGNQRASRTDIGDQKLIDRLPLVRDAMEFARRIRNVFRKRDVQYSGEIKW